MIKYVIFDLDGTLLDTSRGILESVRHTLQAMELPPLSEEEALGFIGPPLRASFMRICGCGEEEARRATDLFRACYQAGALFHAEEYEGLRELCALFASRGVRMAVATNKPQRFAEALLREFALDGFFDPICGADESGSLTKAALICRCMGGMGAERAETVLVGDTDNDAKGAAEAAVSFIAVSYGFGFRQAEDLTAYPCLALADSPAQIGEIVLQSEE